MAGVPVYLAVSDFAPIAILGCTHYLEVHRKPID